MSLSFHLYQLQKIDSQIDQGTARIREIQAKIEADQRVAEAQAITDETQTNLKAAQSHVSRIENDAAAKRMKLEQSEASLYGGKVKIPKELQDLQHEVTSLKKVIAALEDQQLDAMINMEEAQTKLEAAKKNLSHVQAAVTGDHAVLRGENSMLNVIKDKLLVERSAVVQQIDSGTLAEYDRLRKTKRGVAVAAINDDSCSACGTQLTAAQRQTARSPLQLYHCPACGRFIYGG